MSIKYFLKRTINIKNSYLIIILLVSILFIGLYFSYAILTTEQVKRGALNIAAGNLFPYIESADLDDNNQIVVNALSAKDVTIKLKNVNSIKAKYNLYYSSTVSVDDITIGYLLSGDEVPIGKEIDTLDSGLGEETYIIRIINYSESDATITFGSNVGLVGKELSYPEGVNPIEEAMPVVNSEDNMIRVVYDETSSSWKKSDEEFWYDYGRQRWANAVTVTEATRETYNTAEIGTSVSMNDIETMWVYVPRYSYTIGSEDGTNYYGKQGEFLSSTPTLELPGEVDVKFIGKDVKEKGSAKYIVSEGVSGWYTPDAFTFGDDELSGIWVGKFETSSSNPTATNGGGNDTTLSAYIKPNINSWRYINVSSFALVSTNITEENNIYGLSSELDSHAMKNSEWGAMAYLSQSKYGKLGNNDYSEANKEIYANVSNAYITGCSYGAPGSDDITEENYGCQYTYDQNITGTGASTTGTIYGIYDVSGGSYEAVMGNVDKRSGNHSNNGVGNSGYTGLLADNTTFTGVDWLDDKYYDFYAPDDDSIACNGSYCISHAMYDTSTWYGDGYGIPNETYPWSMRSGVYSSGKKAGIFYHGRSYGAQGVYLSFRVVIGVK